MNERPTPETDAARHDLSDYGSPVPCSYGDWVPFEVAEKLERERDEALKLFISSKRARASLSKACDSLQKELRETKRERDEAWACCDELVVDSNAITLAKTVMRLERERDEARSLTEHQWLLKVGSRLFVAGCKSDGIIDSLDEIIRERDEARELCRELVDLVAYGLGQSGEPWSADAMRQARETIQKAKALEAK